jgi:hypothetical protein
MKRILTALAWAFTVIFILSALLMCVVSIVDMISENEDEYLRGGGRHVVESVSPKLSEED